MRLSFARLAVGLLPALAMAGCQRGPSRPEAPVPAVAPTTPSELAAAHAGESRGPMGARDLQAEERKTTKPATRRRWEDPEPIVVRARYDTVRGPCISGSDGSWAMPAIDAFNILEVIRGESRATDIYVRPPYPVGSNYPRGLARGGLVTLRVGPARDEWERLDKRKDDEYRILYVNPEDVERIETPIPTAPRSK